MTKFFKNFEEIVAGTFLVSMVVIVILNVFLRYIFSYSIFWAEEVATICFVWSVFLSASAVYKNKMDVGIDILIKRAPRTFQIFVDALVKLLLLGINGYIFYMAVSFTIASRGKPTAVLGVTSAVVNSALVLSFGLITFHTLRFICHDLLSNRKGAL